MKDREEFLASIYAKRDAQLVQRKTYKKRVVSGLSAAAACLVLMAGLVQFDALDFLGAAAEGAGADGAAVESITENEAPSNSGMEAVDDYALEDSLREEGSANYGETVPDSAPNLSAGGSPGLDTAPKDIYDLDTPNSDSADGSYYYCLPCVTIEDRTRDGEATVMHAAGIETAEKVKAWVDRLAEQGQVVHLDGRLADAALLKMDEVAYIVTIEEEPQQQEIYYLSGEVGWYE